MHETPRASARWASRVRLLSPIGGVSALTFAVATLARRWQQPPQHAHDVGPVMLPVTAFGIALAASALLLLPRDHRLARRGGRVLGVATAVLGFVMVGWYGGLPGAGSAEGHLWGIDSWWSIRPSPMVGLGLSSIGAALWAGGGRRAGHRRLTEAAASSALMIALLAVVGHGFGTSTLYGLNQWSGMAVSTAVSLAALGGGVLFTDPSRGIAALVISRGAGGMLLRRLIPPAILAPLLLGWLALSLHDVGLADPAFAPALLAVLEVVLLVSLIAHQAAVLHTVGEERERLVALERASRTRIATILESITDAFFAVDHGWRFVYANGEAERLLRRPRDELVGRSLWEVFPRAMGATFIREYQLALLDHRSIHFEQYFQDLEAWFEINAFPSPDGVSVYFRDVTARRIAGEQLRQSEERYRLLADLIPQQVWIYDPQGHVTYLSRRGYEFTGATPEQMAGDGWSSLLHPEDRARTLHRWRQAMVTREPYTIEYRFRGADGQYRWFLGQGAPLRDARGAVVQWFGTMTDISERKRYEEERERLLASERDARAEAERRRTELEKVTESRAGLMRGFSHDVRNALNNAAIAADLLETRTEPLTARQAETVARMRRSMRTALRLIDDLLELARAEAGQLELEPVDTEVGPCVAEVVEDFRAQAAAAGLELEVHVTDAVRAWTDPTRLRQILANLLSNAVKYAVPGKVLLGVELRAAGAPGPGEWIAVTVTDDGPGIAPEKSELIFQEYTRLDPKAAHGSGIGLAISRRIAQLLGGDITLRTAPGRGSTFTLWLPDGRPEADLRDVVTH